MNLTSHQFDLASRRIVAALAAVAAATLWSAPDASAVVIEFTPPVAVGDIDEFEISPDGTLVGFVGSLDNGFNNGSSFHDQTYVAPVGGGAAIMVNPPIGDPTTDGDNDGGVAWLPDSSGLVTRREIVQGSPADNEHFLYPADGSMTATQLTSGSGNSFDPQISADGNSLFFSDGGGLFVTSIPGAIAPRIQLNPGDISEIDTGSYAQVGSDIIFSGFATPTPGADNGTPENAFYRTAADGSTAATPTLIPVTNVPAFGDIDFVSVTPDGSTIVFRGDLTVDGVEELYSLPIAGGAATPLLPSNTDPALDVGFFKISPDGSTIAFQGDLNSNGVGELYVIPIGGGTPRVVNDPHQTPGSDVASGVDKIDFRGDSGKIFYLADSRTDGTFELFRVHNPLIPEPSSLVLVVTALCCLGGRRR